MLISIDGQQHVRLRCLCFCQTNRAGGIKAILGVPHVFWGIKQISYTLIDVGHRMRKYLPSSIFTQYELLIRCST